jgi:peptidoglycan/xylan/chitin deacetylase (PgdA/CDA1 family)
MFHHFHNDQHLPSQGSLSSNDFSLMIDWLADRYSLLSASDYLYKLGRGTLADDDIALSFDDALLCQYEIAVPILAERKINAFFFIYSSIFSGNPGSIETFRYFRTNFFSSIDDFYEQFFLKVDQLLGKDEPRVVREYKKLNYLIEYPFYTENDKFFRYLRDQVLGPERYQEITRSLMRDKNFTEDLAKNRYWISEKNIKEISGQGHVIGLHSFSHPTKISALSYREQYIEYNKNFEHLRNLVTDNIMSMAHPCGDFNEDTLRVLKELGIKVGFGSKSENIKFEGNLNLPRNDPANILREMKI